MTAHGTPERYGAGCRCSGCILAMAKAEEGRQRPRYAPSRIVAERLRTGELAVECWCRQSVVYVAPSVIRNNLTESCGRPGCER